MRFADKIKLGRGQAALETLVVLGLYLFVLLFFVNLMFSLSGRIIAQGALNKAVKEVAALGCEPSLTQEGLGGPNTLIDYSDVLRSEIEVFGNKVLTTNNSAGVPVPDITWEYNTSPTTSVPLEKCESVFSFNPAANPPDPAPFGWIITGTVKYEQGMPMLAFLTGSPPQITLKSSMISSSLEKR